MGAMLMQKEVITDMIAWSLTVGNAIPNPISTMDTFSLDTCARSFKEFIIRRPKLYSS